MRHPPGGAGRDATRARAAQTEPQPTPSSQPGCAKNKAKARLLKAVAYPSPPVGRRHQWSLVVLRCPGCSLVHVHRSEALISGGVRVGSCGVAYELAVAGSQRVRWSR
jgi:hypothetical protein